MPMRTALVVMMGGMLDAARWLLRLIIAGLKALWESGLLQETARLGIVLVHRFARWYVANLRTALPGTLGALCGAWLASLFSGIARDVFGLLGLPVCLFYLIVMAAGVALAIQRFSKPPDQR